MTIAKPTKKLKPQVSASDIDSKYQLTPPDAGLESQTVKSEVDDSLLGIADQLDCSSLASAKRVLFPTAAVCLILLSVLAVAYTLYFSKAVMLPIVGAFLLNFLLSPAVAKLNRFGLPNFLGSLGVMTALIGGLVLVLFFAYDPATRWVENKDQNIKIIQKKLLSLRQPFLAFHEMTQELEHLGTASAETDGTESSASKADSSTNQAETVSKIEGVPIPQNQSVGARAATNRSLPQNTADQLNSNANDEGDANNEVVANGAVVPVQVQLPSISNRIFSTSGDVLAGMGLMLVLLFYLLSAGDRGLEKLVELMPSFSQKKRTVELSRAIEKSVSSYMLTTFAINSVLGIVIGFGMWLIGMPNPILWGLVAMQLNFFPFLGALIGAILVFMVAVISFDSVAYACWAPGIYLTANLIEANLITPHVLGRSVSLHPVWLMIFFVIVAWIWGLGGAIIAVPILAVIKISCDHIEPLEPIGQFLGR